MILMPIAANADCPFSDKAPKKNVKKPYYKIYHDGGHHIATIICPNSFPSEHRKKSKDERNAFFDNFYFNAFSSGLKGGEMTEYIKMELLKLFPDADDMDSYIEKRIETKSSNLYKRFKRFRRKANLNQWTHFVTITYNDLLHTEDTFRVKLRRCLSNLHTRRGWRYMGVFERAPDTGRMHFHGIFYVPDGEMLGQLEECTDYDTRSGKMRTTTRNSFFTKNFGRNDFEELSKAELQSGYTLGYLSKYIGKTNERFVYSRGVPASICKQLDDSDIACEMSDFVLKFVLFDDVIDWERDVARFKPKQMTFADLRYKPSKL